MKRKNAKYSGKPSEEFWKRVEKIRSSKAHDLIYIASCALQDHESRVLQMLERAEKSR